MTVLSRFLRVSRHLTMALFFAVGVLSSSFTAEGAQQVSCSSVPAGKYCSGVNTTTNCPAGCYCEAGTNLVLTSSSTMNSFCNGTSYGTTHSSATNVTRCPTGFPSSSGSSTTASACYKTVTLSKNDCTGTLSSSSKTCYNNGQNCDLGSTSGLTPPTGYRLLGGWGSATTCTSTSTSLSNSTIASYSTFYACKTNKYKISWNANGGSMSTVTRYAMYGYSPLYTQQSSSSTTTGSVPIPTKTGYDFLGWYTAASGGSQIYTSSGTLKSSTVSGYIDGGVWKPTSNNLPLYAHWSPVQKTIVFDANGGSNPSSYTSGMQVQYDSAALYRYVGSWLPIGVVPIPTRAGYKFDGWYTAASGGSQIYTSSGTLSSSTVSGYIGGGVWKATSAPTLYAHWVKLYKITLDKGYGDDEYLYTVGGELFLDDTGTTEYVSGQDYSLFDDYGYTYPYKTGYSFDGYESPSFQGPIIDNHGVWDDYYRQDLDYLIQDDETWTAQYSPQEYNITLNNNGATSAGTTKLYTRYDSGVYLNSYRSSAYLMSTSANPITNPTKTGWTFLGYYSSSSGGTKYINPTNSTNGHITSSGINVGKTATSNQNWYARWSRTIPSGQYWTGSALTSCTQGYYCPGGATIYNNTTYTTGRYSCPVGSYSSSGASVCTPCPSGTTTSSSAQTSSSSCNVTCPSSSNVGSWVSPSWNQNKLINSCVINACSTGYHITNTPVPSAALSAWASPDEIYPSALDSGSSYWYLTAEQGKNLYVLEGDSVCASNTSGVAPSGSGNECWCRPTYYHYDYDGDMTDYTLVENWTRFQNMNNCSADCALECVYMAEGGSFSPSYDASCIANTFNVSYGNGGGTGTAPSSPTSCTYNGTCNAPQNTFTKTGYTFSGWTCIDGSTGGSCAQSTYAAGASISTATTANGAMVSLVPEWTANTYTITLNPNYSSFGGTKTAGQTALYTKHATGVYTNSDRTSAITTTTNITAPTLDGWTFNGYYNTSGSGGTQRMSTATVNSQRVGRLSTTNMINNAKNITADTTWYARWSKNCSAGTYYPGSYSSTCTTCPAGSYCPGITVYNYNANSVAGLYSCQNNFGISGLTSDAGAKGAYACYKTGTTTCAAANPVSPNDSHATGVIYANSGNVNCKYYLEYDNDEGGYIDALSSCIPDPGVCDVTGLTCATGYTSTQTDYTLWSDYEDGSNFDDYIEFEPSGQIEYNDVTSSRTGKANGEYDVIFDYGTVRGRALCSATSGTNGVSGTPSSTAGGHCWCKTTLFKTSSGNPWTLAMSDWVKSSNASVSEDDYDNCMNECSYKCAAESIGSNDRGVRDTAVNTGKSYYCKANTFTVTYAANNGTGTAPSNQTCTYNGTCNAATNPFTRTGYTFSGWACSASSGSCAQSTYAAGVSISNATTVAGATITLTAQWTPNCNAITLNPYNGTSGSISTLYKKTGSTTWYIDNSCSTEYTSSHYNSIKPTRNGYTFIGFYTGGTSSVSSDFSGGPPIYLLSSGAPSSSGNSLTISGATTVYSWWAQNCTVPSNGTCILTISESTSGADYTTTCDTGYTISGNNTATPSCTANSYSITYYDGNTVISGLTSSYTYGTGIDSLQNAPEKTNHVFAGWYDNAQFTGDPITSISTTAAGNKVFYAKYNTSIYCEPGTYLKGERTECSGCAHGYYCTGGNYDFGANDQGLTPCPSVVNDTGAFNGSWFFLSSSDYESQPSDCTVSFSYTYDPTVVNTIYSQNTAADANYSPTNNMNKDVAYMGTYCKYNTQTQRYDRCHMLYHMYYPLICKNGYYVPEADMPPFITDLISALGSVTSSPCVPVPAGYYTKFYDTNKSSSNATAAAMADKVGAMIYQDNGTVSYYGVIGVQNGALTFDQVVGQCPTEYPNSAAGSWKIEQCNATVTFNANGGTVTTPASTNTYYFNGTSDGTNITTDSYQITSFPTVTRSGYTFRGWNTAADGTGDTITDSSWLTGNQILYAQWCPNITNYGEFYSGYLDVGDNSCLVEYYFTNQSSNSILKYIIYQFSGVSGGADMTYIDSVIAQYRSANYSGTTSLNAGVDTLSITCKYNSSTGKYDLCGVYGQFTYAPFIACKAGYYTPTLPSSISMNNALAALQQSPTQLSNLCVPAADGYYTTMYDTMGVILDAELTNAQQNGEDIDQTLLDIFQNIRSNVGTLAYGTEESQALNYYYLNMLLGPETLADQYAQCPTEYSHTDGAASRVAQCYANVTFNANGGTVTTPASTTKYYFNGTVAAGSTTRLNITPSSYQITSFPTVSRNGYTFNGWNTAANGTGDTITNASNVTGDQVLYAQWSQSSFNITYYDGNYATAMTGLTPATYTFGTGVATLPTPTKNGYTFNGWYDSNGTQVTSIANNATGNISLYAHWNVACSSLDSYTNYSNATGATYGNSNGGNAECITNASGTCELVTANACDITSLTCDTNYHFVERNNSPSSVLPSVPTSLNDIIARYTNMGNLNWSNSNIGYYGQFTRAGEWATEYINTTNNQNGEIHGMAYCRNTENDPADATSATLPGTAFGGSCWCKVERWNGQSVESNYYHTWYYPEAGNCVGGCPGNCVNVAQGNSIWNAARAAYQRNSITAIPLQCAPDQYTISYENMTGATNYNRALTRYDVETSTITLGNPTKTGYTFGGWCDNEQLQNCSTSKKITHGSTGDKTFYAKWTATNYTITYNNMANATNNANNPANYNIESADITLQNPTKTGYTFGGWYTDSELTNAASTPAIAQGSHENKTFWAKWTVDTYTITYNNVTGATNTNPATYDVTDLPLTLQASTKAGSVFVGWYDNAQFTGDKVTSITTETMGNKTLHAKWAKFAVSVTVAAGDTIGFVLSPKGTFSVDWGDGTVQNIDRSGLTASELTETSYTHPYENAGTYLIAFDGLADRYSTLTTTNQHADITNAPVSTFRFTTNKSKITAAYGRLGRIFPTKNNGTNEYEQSKFLATFMQATNLASIPYDMFYGDSGANDGVKGGGKYMFAVTFYNTAIPNIPENSGLFAGITGGGYGMFWSTFHDVKTFTSIPSDIFSNVTISADYQFAQTFRGTYIRQIPPTLFSHITTRANGLFSGTFWYCIYVSTIPGNLFSTVVNGNNSYGMFNRTFANMKYLTTVQSGLFDSVTTPSTQLFESTFASDENLKYIPYNLFGNLTGTPSTKVFWRTFTGCTSLDTIVHHKGPNNETHNTNFLSPAFFGNLNLSTYSTSKIIDMFENNPDTKLATTCPSGTTATNINTSYASGLNNKAFCEYDINYENMTGATNNESNPATYIDNTSAITLAAPTKIGYTFGGWYTDSNLTSQATTPQIAAYEHGAKTFYAAWTQDVYQCPAGQYLPAGQTSCSPCLNNNYCDGTGSFNYNANSAQGMTQCPVAHQYAPAGMWMESQCGRILHLGDEMLYLHQQPAYPSLHQLKVLYSLNNTEYSANAVLRDTNSNDFPKMSAGMTKGLHVMIHETIDGVEGDYEYLICDDSVPECRNDAQSGSDSGSQGGGN